MYIVYSTYTDLMKSTSDNHANVQIFVCEERTNFHIDLSV